MTEQELKQQRIQAKANLAQLTQLHRRSQATAEQVAEAQRIYDQIRAYKIPDQSATSQPEPSLQSPRPAMPVSDFTKLLEDLSSQRAQARKEMALLSNELVKIPDNENAKALVDKIQEWKVKRNALAEKIAYLQHHGHLPEPEPVSPVDLAPDEAKSAFLKNLPTDRYELHQLLVNQLKPKLYRAKKRLAGAKQLIYIQQYQKEVALYEIQVDEVKRQIAACS